VPDRQDNQSGGERRIVPLDLADTVERGGLGDRPLDQLALRCPTCGSGSFGLICHTGHAGPAWGRPKPRE
jgi:hypothetical protein